ncbi:hypothetical protein OG21DRAFT_1409288 [Imleria badia]|nr:hypothetical protein OG21DRAFT_1409288 [Imleria badia]
MPDDPNNNADPSSSSAAVPRSKPHRAATTSAAVRSRTSPTPGDHDPRPPTKRARKAINCEPCRNSKLKCDRNRPCSSCPFPSHPQLGTIALCYQDAKGHESDLHLRDDHNASRVDPMQEITRLKHSVSLLETYILANHRPGASHLKHPLENPALPMPKKEPVETDILEKDNVPGMLGSHGHGGFYTGATSAVTHLTLNSRQSDDSDRQPSHDALDEILTTTEYDRDLLALLPPLETIDGLVSYYFEYCNWIYRHVNQPAFLNAWSRYKTGTNADRVVLATVCMVMAIAVHYLPPGDRLVAQLGDSLEDICRKFYEVMRSALERHRAEHKTYSLELVECLLIRSHYLTLVKTDSEEIWTVRGELVSIGMAMGLHRDPFKWRMSKELAERRRWAWWHIILLERWQAFMFGRPITIASHHFDTQLPDTSDPAHHPDEPRIYVSNLHLFRLAYILGDIMDSAVSMRPVAYETVQAHDRALTQWMDTLPPELDLDEFRVARSLASPNTITRRLGVQSVIIRTSFYHIRFTLHRPYASAPSPKGDKQTASSKDKHERHVVSLDIAVGAADKLITLVGQARPDFLANASLAVPGHMNWGPFHVFSSAMFFSFQLISNPDQPGASLFRANIQKALTTLELSRGSPVADKALDILRALAPLYSQDFANEAEQERERMKSRVLSLVKTLAFPYHDSPKYPRVNAVDSPNAPGYVSSPATGNSGSPQGVNTQPRGSIDYGNGSGKTANTSSSSLVGYAGIQASPVQSMSTQGIVAGPSSSSPIAYSVAPPQSSQSQSQLYSDASRAPYTVEPSRNTYGDTARPPGTVSANPYPDTRTTASYSESYPSRPSYPDSTSSRSFVDPTRQSYPDPSRQQYMSGDAALGRYPYSYPTATEEATMWGASLSQAEWARFLDVMQHPRHTGDRQ